MRDGGGAVALPAVRRYWEAHPCGAADAATEMGTDAFFEDTEARRAARDEFMDGVVGFDRWRGRSVLEVGCGIGADTVRFAAAGARTFAVDLTSAGTALTRRRLTRRGLPAAVAVGDAESLPFPGDSFDLVFCWGVIHHTPRPWAAADELRRVCRPGGRVLAMVYNRRSLVALQAWMVFGLLRGRPWASPSRLIGAEVESPGTRAFTRHEARELLAGLDGVSSRSFVTAWDTRLGRRRFLPAPLARMVPSGLGWFLVVEGMKP